MIWIIRLSRNAAKQLRRLSRDQQTLVRKRFQEMRDDPLRGNVISLKGKQWQGRYRKRSGRYRIIFILHHAEHIVEVSAILLRNEHMYR